MKKNKMMFLPALMAGLLLILATGCEKDEENTVTDIDGNVYRTVTIGTQVWMAGNLRVTRFNDGTAIPLVSDGPAWAKLSTPAYCWYENDEQMNKNTYGALYNGYALDSGKICPRGWHVPDDSEWTTLAEYLGGDSIAGGKLKEADTLHWESPNTGATNETGFSALPGGGHYYNGNYGWAGYYGTYWTSTESSATAAWTRYMKYNSKELIRDKYDKKNGFSVCCVKD